MKCAGARERPIVRKHVLPPSLPSESVPLVQEKRLLSSLWVHCGGLGPLIAAYDEFSKGTGLEQRFVLESHFSIESGWSWGLGFGFP